MKRFYLTRDLRFNIPHPNFITKKQPILYFEFRGGIRKNQTRKGLRLQVPIIQSDASLKGCGRVQLVKINMKGEVIR